MTLTALFLLQEFIVLEILNTLTKNVSQDGANTLSDTFVSCSICFLANMSAFRRKSLVIFICKPVPPATTALNWAAESCVNLKDPQQCTGPRRFEA